MSARGENIWVGHEEPQATPERIKDMSSRLLKGIREMTLSVGDLVRKYTRDGAGPVENESHVLFEVAEVYSGWEPSTDPGTPGRNVQIAKLVVRE